MVVVVLKIAGVLMVVVVVVVVGIVMVVMVVVVYLWRGFVVISWVWW